MSAYPIEKGIPIPDRAQSPNDRKYNWRAMEVGDSFLAPHSTAVSLTTAAYRAGCRLGWDFAVRTTPQGPRVWRVK